MDVGAGPVVGGLAKSGVVDDGGVAGHMGCLHGCRRGARPIPNGGIGPFRPVYCDAIDEDLIVTGSEGGRVVSAVNRAAVIGETRNRVCPADGHFFAVVVLKSLAGFRRYGFVIGAALNFDFATISGDICGKLNGLERCREGSRIGIGTVWGDVVGRREEFALLEVFDHGPAANLRLRNCAGCGLFQGRARIGLAICLLRSCNETLVETLWHALSL